MVKAPTAVLSLEAAPASGELFLRPRRGEAHGLLVNDNRALQFPTIFFELVLCLRIEIHERPSQGSVCARRPSCGSNRQRMLRGTDNSRARRSPRPGMRDRPLLEMHVDQPVLAEHLRRPIVC